MRSSWAYRSANASASYQTTKTIPEDVHADSRRAVTTHPNVVLLPLGYTIGKYVAGSWRSRSATYPMPQAAWDAESFSVADIIPDENTPMEEFTAAYDRAPRDPPALAH